MQTVYNSTPETRIEGATYLPESDINGNLKVTDGTLSAGEKQDYDAVNVGTFGTITYITTATTTTITGPVHVNEIVYQGGTSGNITIYNNSTASAPIVYGTLTPTNVGQVLLRNTTLTGGLTIVTAAASHVQVNTMA